LQISEQADSVTCFFQYRREALAPTEASRLIGWFERLLARAMEEPEVRMQEFKAEG